MLSPADIAGDLADLCRGGVGGRASAGEITLFKSVGNAAQDVAMAAAALRAAEEKGLGVEVPFG